MTYIYRELQEKIKSQFEDESAKGLILSGIVGSGKTTMVEFILDLWKDRFEVFAFTGDSSRFRELIRNDTEYLYNFVRSKTTQSALLFVDEVQKCEEVFDAIKIAFDRGKISFIVSGSNPSYLGTVARKRLQRRAELFVMAPFSLPEVMTAKNLIPKIDFFEFERILWHEKNPGQIDFPKLTMNEGIRDLAIEYFIYGGLPLSYLTKKKDQKLVQIRLMVERGIELMSADNNYLADTVRIELAHLHSQEFAYKNIFEKTRIKNRDQINLIIDQLINHGYLVRKKPIFLENNRTSYLSIFSYTDPGIVSYLTGNYDWSSVAGQRVEGYIHERISILIANSPFKSSLHYFKPYTIDANDKVKYQSGEIDFIFQHGRRIIPIEVKSTFQFENLNLTPIAKFMSSNKVAFGIIIYGGVPFFDKERKLLFWPFWLV
jgi:predicted AAA+ superfamily ATPase